MNIDPQPKPIGFVVVRCPQCLCTAILLSYEDEDPDRAYWCPCQAGTQAMVIARIAPHDASSHSILEK